MSEPFHPLAAIFPLLTGGEFDALVESIKQNGLREPIWRHRDDRIVDGRNRWRACQEAGVECPSNTFIGSDEELLAFIIDLNLRRRHLNESQRAMVAAELANLQVGRPSEKAPIDAISDAQAATLLNVSEKSVERAKAVKRQAEPEVVKLVEDGKMAVSAAVAVAKATPERQKRVAAKIKDGKRAQAAIREVKKEDAAGNAPALPADTHRTIVCDPPWPMEKLLREVRPNQVDFDYPTMTIDEIKALKDALPAADDCHLFLWTTQKFLPAALEVVAAWGFRYVLTMVWHKPGGFQPVGLPQYNCEFALYARKGAPEFIDTRDFFCCFEAPRREHSRKPDEFYDVIRRVTEGPRIDMFSREPRDGFGQWGNETGRFAGNAA